jgi:hypothetical protein
MVHYLLLLLLLRLAQLDLLTRLEINYLQLFNLCFELLDLFILSISLYGEAVLEFVELVSQRPLLVGILSKGFMFVTISN